MLYRWAADLTVLLHFLFILFVVFGALLVSRLAWLKHIHWAALGYGLLVEIFNWYCPLTLLEQSLRRAAGQAGYERSFLVHYLDWLIYWDVPQWVLIAGATIVVLANTVFYSRAPAAAIAVRDPSPIRKVGAHDSQPSSAADR